MELSEKLKQIRKENNLTQQQLADELCLSRTVITKYEKGYKVPNLSTLIMISNYFGTNIFDDYKDRIKLFILSIKCVLPYLISLFLLILSALGLVYNAFNVNNQYGYNIYDDELKVKNSNEIYIIKYSYINNDNENFVKVKKIITLNSIYRNENYIFINSIYFNKFDEYYIVFLQTKYINDVGLHYSNYVIDNKPFIYFLKDYDESLPYNKQTGECSKILNYYIDLIDKVK